MITVTVILSSVAGAVLSSLLACVPGLHVYNVLGIMVMAAHSRVVPPEMLVPFSTGMIVGFSMVNTIPSVLLAAPDESAFFTVLPGQKYLMNGRGYEGTMITAVGGLAGLFILVLIAGPFAPRFLPVARAVFQPHMHWILWCVICFMLMSEWPKEGMRGRAGWSKLLEGCKSTGAGLLTFVLSGLLGFVLLYRSPISAEVAFQNLMPAFVGLFGIPWLILNMVNRTEMPQQRITGLAGVNCDVILRGAFAGGLGGGFAAFFPAVTGGVGGLLAGHATALRDDRVFLASQGTSKLVYYVGGFLFFFVPGLHMTRGGGAWLLRGLYLPHTYRDYHMVLASIAIAGAVSFLLVSPLARGVISVIGRYGYRRISCAALIVIITIVFGMTGLMGLFVMFVSVGIGLIPVLFGARRMNCLGVILLPVACNMSGIGAAVAGRLGLL